MFYIPRLKSLLKHVLHAALCKSVIETIEAHSLAQSIFLMETATS